MTTVPTYVPNTDPKTVPNPENETKSMVTGFQEMRLPPQIRQALTDMHFHTPTPIQAQAIPLVLARKDLIGCAQTGTGKTAAFCIPMVTRLIELPQKTALILVPTRELAVQIQEVLRKLILGAPYLRSACLIGGADMGAQVRALTSKPRIIVATPGRLMDHLRRGRLSLRDVDMLVLDEGDRMLDMGFAQQLGEILRFLPSSRQTLLFSATLDDKTLALSKKYLKDPVRVTIGQEFRPVAKIDQASIQITPANKNDTLLNELNARQGSILIFTRTKHRTDKVAQYLGDYGFSVTRIHGGRSQGQRNAAITGFRSGKYRILVATDIAARGLDIPQIAHVINYDLPMAAEDYIHRIGRTARAGAEGQSLSLLLPEDKGQWYRISKMLGNKVQGPPPVENVRPGQRNAKGSPGKPSGGGRSFGGWQARKKAGGPPRGRPSARPQP